MPLALNEYQLRTAATDRTKTTKGLHLAILGLFGEAGSLLSEVKKKQRDSMSYIGYEDVVTEEMGDVLWYLATIANHAGLMLSSIAAPSREVSGEQSLATTFNDLQPQSQLALDAPTLQFEQTLLTFAAGVGKVADAAIAKDLGGVDNAAAHLAAVFSALVRAADEAGISLEAAAERNLKKIVDRWPTTRVPSALFDDGYPPEEQLPRSFAVDIFERKASNGKTYVVQRCNGIYMGDRLTDNIIKPDDYRFHDVFHYAYAAVLGWSPVTRALFKLKRKSVGKVDEAQDGARAIQIEEGVSTYVFGEAKHLQFFEGRQRGDLSFSFLKSVRQFVRGFEPEVCALWQWEDAILQGNAAFRFLREKRRGRVHMDLHARSIRVEELPE